MLLELLPHSIKRSDELHLNKAVQEEARNDEFHLCQPDHPNDSKEFYRNKSIHQSDSDEFFQSSSVQQSDSNEFFQSGTGQVKDRNCDELYLDIKLGQLPMDSIQELYYFVQCEMTERREEEKEEIEREEFGCIVRRSEEADVEGEVDIMA